MAVSYLNLQTLNEEDALQIALSESLSMHHSRVEEEELAMAIEMSLMQEEEEKEIKDSGIFIPMKLT
jgi:hypothetical protein